LYGCIWLTWRIYVYTPKPYGQSQNKHRVHFYHLSLTTELALKMKDSMKLGSSAHITSVQAFDLKHNHLCIYMYDRAGIHGSTRKEASL